MVFSVSSLTKGMHHFHEERARYAADESRRVVLSFFTSHRVHTDRLRLAAATRPFLLECPLERKRNRDGKRKASGEKRKGEYIREQRVLRTLSRLHPLAEFIREPFTAVEYPTGCPRYMTDKRSFVTRQKFLLTPRTRGPSNIDIYGAV